MIKKLQTDAVQAVQEKLIWAELPLNVPLEAVAVTPTNHPGN
jgi:hypothetical protein